MNHLRGQVEALSKTNELSKESFEQSDSKVTIYTGLPNWEVFSDLSKETYVSMHSSLTPFNQLLTAAWHQDYQWSGQ